MNYSTCKACGAPILWIKTPTGKNMPVDAKPVIVWPNGNAQTTFMTGSGKIVRGDRTEYPAEGTCEGYIVHWSTCPAADKFRRKKDAKEKEN